MIWIKPYQTFKLTHELGGIFWSYENGGLFGIDAFGTSGRRFLRNLTDLSEDEVLPLYFPPDVRNESLTLSSDFFSGYIGVLINRKFISGSVIKTVPCIYWFNGGSSHPSGYSHLYGGAANFARVARTGVLTYTFHFSESDGNMARWDSEWTSKDTPESKEQLVPWRGVNGQVRSLALQDPNNTQLPKKYLIIASPKGEIRWADISLWMSSNKVLPIYKSLGVIKCSDLRDITIDRVNNILWILDGGKKLHLVALEPFGTEETGYTNTPKALELTPELRFVDPGQEIDVEAQLLDMWGQPVPVEDKEVQFVSSGLGEFYIGGDEEKWGITVTTNTDTEGIARAVYRGSESNS